jgi:hypothetical protein
MRLSHRPLLIPLPTPADPHTQAQQLFKKMAGTGPKPTTTSNLYDLLSMAGDE